MKKISLTILVAALPGLSLAQDQNNYQCTQGDLVRRVEIVYETGVTVPCEVHYYKDTEAPGETQVLWRALNQEGYCEAKTQEFITKLGSWGWDCTAAAPAEGDDSQDLTPAEENADPDASHPS